MPRVSIVTATYNRSNVLRHAVETVRWQTVTDWELLIVGDGCTDDTASAVASFGDGRIRFTNLARNHGEQSVPNNAGVAQATGEYLAFLNHDDLWFHEHLETLLDAIERTGADLVYGQSVRMDADGSVHLWGNSPGGRYAFWHTVPASLWLMRRDLASRVGPWRPGTDLYDAPSQDWLRRAHARGADMRPASKLTSVQIGSGHRRDSYRNRDEHEHLAALTAMREGTACRERMLMAIADQSSGMATYASPLVLTRRALKALVARVCITAGVPPVAFFCMLRYGRRGNFIRSLRRTRGLEPAFGSRR